MEFNTDTFEIALQIFVNRRSGERLLTSKNFCEAGTFSRSLKPIRIPAIITMANNSGSQTCIFFIGEHKILRSVKISG
jgi:hypothetical protein